MKGNLPMKKLISILVFLLAAVMLTSVFTACNGEGETTTAAPETTAAPVVTEAPNVTEAPETTKAPEKSGCGAAISGGAIVAILCMGIAMIAKKKEN